MTPLTYAINCSYRQRLFCVVALVFVYPITVGGLEDLEAIIICSVYNINTFGGYNSTFGARRHQESKLNRQKRRGSCSIFAPGSSKSSIWPPLGQEQMDNSTECFKTKPWHHRAFFCSDRGEKWIEMKLLTSAISCAYERHVSILFHLSLFSKLVPEDTNLTSVSARPWGDIHH